MNLKMFYEQVCKARPDAVIDLLSVPNGGRGWQWDYKYIETNVVEAIITRVWLNLLPIHHGPMRADDNPGPRWYVDGIARTWPCRDTPLEAIAAYLMKEVI